MSIKIMPEKLQAFNAMPSSAVLRYFGEWTCQHELAALQHKYRSAEPYEHIIIDHFLNENVAKQISALFPTDVSKYYHYNNPIEVKYAYDDIHNLPSELQDIFYLLSTDVMENVFSCIVGDEIHTDPYLHGAGLHLHPRNGRLAVHLDYETHPISGAQRRLNIILHLSKEWKEEWNGHTELWNSSHDACMVASAVTFNRAVIFKTNDISWHGISKKIACPEGIYRKTLAFYYVSNQHDATNAETESETETETNAETETETKNNGKSSRKKALFVCDSNDHKDKLEPLLHIRQNRRIEWSDVIAHWPEWNADEF